MKFDNLRKKIENAPFLSQLFLSFFSVLILEAVARKSFLSSYIWLLKYPHHFLFLTILILMSIRLVFSLVCIFHLSWLIIFIPCFILSLIHSVKLSVRNEPLMPWDLKLYNEAFKIFDIGFFPFSFLNFLIIIFFMAILYFFSSKIIIKKLSSSSKLFSLGVPAAIFLIFINLHHMEIWHKYCQKNDFNFSKNNQNVLKIGFLPTFFLNFTFTMVEKPSNYSSELAYNILYNFNNSENSKEPSDDSISLIIILSESFWDPFGFKNLIFLKDPIPNFHSLIKEDSYINLISPVLAGNTCNVEFELLTGLSMAFLPLGSIPYQQFIKRKTESLASILADQGYYPIAIHPFYKFFFNRDQVYPLLGFNDFISMESMNFTDESGHFISDMSLTSEIIDRSKNLPIPFFIFAVSMENHGYYPPKRYKNNFKDFDISDNIKNLEKNEKAVLSTYLTGLQNADLALGELLNYFKKSKNKTIIVFLGDHLPYLDEEFSIFKKLGYLNNEKKFPKMYKQKAVFWTNFKTINSCIKEDLSVSYLPSLILSKLEKRSSRYLNYSFSFSKKYPVLHQEKIPQNIDNYRVVQYYKLFEDNR